MSVVILGGNECMERQYKDLCRDYKCRVKVFIKPVGNLKNKMIFFTSTMSHKMLRSALRETKGLPTVIARSHSSSMAALRNILDTHAAS